MVKIGRDEKGRWKKGFAPGRPKGTPNKTSKEIAQRILNTLALLDEDAQTDWLMKVSKSDPRGFMMLLRACLPRDSSVEITQREGNADQASLLQRLIAAKRAG